mmetsp:Transcript_51898/g.135973  ORF Transcript_51898/g.135973 Transcript_51898/m.135973 type:complete len:220 (+) Transcript_51898:284-943(+)
MISRGSKATSLGPPTWTSDSMRQEFHAASATGSECSDLRWSWGSPCFRAYMPDVPAGFEGEGPLKRSSLPSTSSTRPKTFLFVSPLPRMLRPRMATQKLPSSPTSSSSAVVGSAEGAKGKPSCSASPNSRWSARDACSAHLGHISVGPTSYPVMSTNSEAEGRVTTSPTQRPPEHEAHQPIIGLSLMSTLNIPRVQAHVPLGGAGRASPRCACLGRGCL